jgi:putative oxidoreductase
MYLLSRPRCVKTFAGKGADMALSLMHNGARLRSEAALVAPRAALGATMVFHGLGKLRGDAPQQTGEVFEKLGLRPGKPLAVATGIAETFAGVAALLGFWTRPAALAVLVTQGVAIAKVHRKNGFDITKGGFEFNLLLMAIAASLLLRGPGRFSAHGGLEHLAHGRGPRRLLSHARPSPLLRFLHAVQ